MQYRFMVDKEKAITASIVCLLCAVITGVMIYLGRMGSFMIFAAVALLFGWLAAANGAVIILNQTGITKTLFGRTWWHMDWKDVVEAGVCGINLLNRSCPEKAGRLYIYCSAKQMDSDDRYAMILKWPPRSREQLYYIFTRQGLDALRLLWDGELQEYNVGTLCL